MQHFEGYLVFTLNIVEDEIDGCIVCEVCEELEERLVLLVLLF